jgi:hypothetical protein
MIGFIGTSITSSLNHTQLQRYRSIATHFQFTVAWALGFSVFNSSLLATNLSTRSLSLQITMKSSCCFVFNHSVLLCPNVYSTNLHNSLTTCSILVLVFSTAPSFEIHFSYKHSAQTPQKTPLLLYCWEGMFTTRLPTNELVLPMCYVTANHRNTCHVIPTHCCVTSPAHALFSHGTCADTKETLPQYCCAAHALERAPWAGRPAMPQANPSQVLVSELRCHQPLIKTNVDTVVSIWFCFRTVVV